MMSVERQGPAEDCASRVCVAGAGEFLCSFLKNPGPWRRRGMVRGSQPMSLPSSLSPACEDPPAVLLEVQGTLQRPVGRDSRSSPANCTWLILGSKEQTVTVR